MALEEFIYRSNTAGISNVSTRGQPITSTLCKKDIKGSIKSAISWSSTSEGSDYWFGLYVNTKK